MNYSTENIAASLKKARENKGLSQRELSARSGVPQSHISKIESNTVDLRLSSLSTLAHALDLELAMIPRKAMPAVKSIARSAGNQKTPNNNDALRELARVQRAFNVLPKALQDGVEGHAFQNKIQEILSGYNSLLEKDAFRQLQLTSEATANFSAIKVIEKFANSESMKKLQKVTNSESIKNLRKITKDTQRIRNMLAHGGSSGLIDNVPSRPAYSLDEVDDDD